ncbi:MAG: protein kinase [archaeon]|nr:protein kinase [archaeon]
MPIRTIGQGAFGSVCSAKDLATGKQVAIKKISNTFAKLQDCKRTLREIKLLRHFRHENVIALLDIIPPPDRGPDWHDVYLVYELMDSDLGKIIRTPQALSKKHIQYFLYQILRGLKYLHSANVFHRDLKPCNLLLNENCTLKIADFGLARVEEEIGSFMTAYVATRWWRAPEVILTWKEYSKAIDMWSVGCILAELYLRKPLFQGVDYLDQLRKIFRIIGTPSEDEISSLPTVKAQQFVRDLGFIPRANFAKIFPSATPDALDLLHRLLAYDPEMRITVEAALEHPFISKLHDPAYEPCAPSVFDFDFEKWNLGPEIYRDLIYREILGFSHDQPGPNADDSTPPRSGLMDDSYSPIISSPSSFSGSPDSGYQNPNTLMDD